MCVNRRWIFQGIAAVLALSATVTQLRAQEQRTMLQVSTGGVSGTYYMIAAPLAKFINERSPNLRMTPNTSGGGYENIRRVDAGLAQLGMTQPDTMYEAWQGQKPFSKPLRNWRVIGVVTPPMANHVLTLAQDNIKTAEDLKGKIFAIGAPGSGSTVSMIRLLEHAGLRNAIDVRMLPHQDYPDMLLDGKIHAFSRLGSVPAAVVDEVGTQKKVNLVDFGPVLDRSGFLEKFPYYQKVLVKAGTYKGIDRDVTLFGNAGFFIAHKDLPEDVVYQFTKLAYSDEAVRTVTMAFAGVNMDRSNPLEGNIGQVHPGAARYWKEIGVNVPEPFLK